MNLETLKGIVIKNGLQIKDGHYIEFNKNTPDFQILPNFRLQEFLTKNKKDTFTRLNLNIMLEAQDLRTKFGSGIIINSSYRSPAYNKSIGGAEHSEHMNGNALDTKPANGDIKGWKKTVRENKKTGGRGLNYEKFVHIDTGRTRTW